MFPLHANYGFSLTWYSQLVLAAAGDHAPCMQTHAAAVNGDQILRLEKILRVTTDAHDQAAIKALIQELVLRQLEARNPQ
jgi:hypothetical protein